MKIFSKNPFLMLLALFFVVSLFGNTGCRLNDNRLRGQIGSPSTANLEDCSTNAVSTGECKVANAGIMVTDQFGANIITWSNATASTTVSATIPNAYYDNKSIDLTDADLLAANILSGIEIFGVTGTMTADGTMSNAHRDQGATQLTQNAEVTNHSGSGGTPDLPAGYRSVPQIALDDEGADATNVTFVDRTGWGVNTCGDSQATVDLRIADCAAHGTIGPNATWDGAAKGNAGQGVWKLVSRTGDLAGGMGEEVWKDMRTGLLWSSKVSIALNWCKASGSNEIAGNPALADDPSDYCDQEQGTPDQYQNESGLAISACFEDDGTFFTTTDGGIDNAGKAGLGYASTPSVRWRLPTIYDYKHADVNGIRFVLPDMDANYEWSASVLSTNRNNAWIFGGSFGFVANGLRYVDLDVRCVGR